MQSTQAAHPDQPPLDEDDVPRETESVPPPLEAAEVEDDSEVVFDSVPLPARTRTLVVANQKGGVGKTTTAVNLAAALAGSGCRVLVVDLDPQGNASTAFNIEHHDEVPSVYESLIDTQPLGDVVHPVRRFPSLFAIPATIDLSGAELELVSVIARESRLKKALEIHCSEREAAGERYDYILIDCPPSLGLLTINALVAGDEVLVPIQCEYYALEGVGALWRTIERVRTQLNPQLQISTVLLTMYDARTRLSAQVADEVRSNLGDAVLSTVIPRSVRISEAPSFQQTVLTWDPNSPGALSYLNAAREIAGRAERL
jgi:chromosome partitioning protein